MSVEAKPTIFLVEDEGIIAADIEMRLEKLGYTVVGKSPAGEEALPALEKLRPDLVLMDIRLRGQLTGIETAEVVRNKLRIPVVFLTAHGDANTLAKAKVTEPFGYIIKPFEERELHATVEIALYRSRVEAKLRNLERWLATTLRSIGDAVIATDVEGRVTYMNSMAQALTEQALDDVRGKPIQEVAPLILAAENEAIENPIFAALREGVVVHLRDGVVLRRASGDLYVDDSAAPLRDDHGAVTGAVIVFRDSSERVRTERELKALNKELEAKAHRSTLLEAENRRMEEFIFTVSHDLRAPLRAITSYAALIEPANGGAADDNAEFLMRIRGNAQRMVQLLDDYLALSRIGHQALKIDPTDMTLLAREVAARLQASNATIQIEDLPQANVDRNMMTQVWENLLTNSLKYSSSKAHPEIRVTGQQQLDRLSFTVADNGVGFNSSEADKIFTPFHRLPGNSGVEGAGVGLAIVKRIIEAHGGQVWATGEPGLGASFTFTLPVRAA
ncbi:MAG TPA: ATP-binding protein [Methylomirabilota bacterium]|nr:ATP-binding protein [Methylomirabilota bacterium]